MFGRKKYPILPIKIGIELSWVYKYNAGANSIGLNLPKLKMKNILVLEFLEDSYVLA